MNEGRYASGGDIAEMLFRHKKKIIFTPLMIGLVAAAVILWWPRTYQSEAKVFLQVGRESVGLDPTATTGNTISLQQNGRDNEVVSAMDVLASRGLASKVVDALGPDYILRGGPEDAAAAESAITKAIKEPVLALVALLKSIDPVSDREEAIIELEENLTLDSERDSTVIVVQVDAKTPQGAQEILAKLVEIYQQEHLRIHRNPDSRNFFAEQRDMLERRLEEANEAVRAAKAEMGLASVEDRRLTLEGQVRAIELEAYSTEQDLAMAEARVGDLEKKINDEPERLVSSQKSIPNQGADLLREQLYTLQMRQMELKARYNDSHPLVVAIADQVQEAEKVFNDQSEQRQETTNDLNPIHRKLSLDLRQQQVAVAGYQQRLKTLQKQRELVIADLKQLITNEIRLDDLQREVSIARTKFFKYAENLEQARIDEALEEQKISSASIAQSATLSEKPVSPSKLLVGLGAILLAFGGTVSWVAASEQLNNKLHSGDEAERQLGLPVFAEIPRSQVHGRVLNY